MQLPQSDAQKMEEKQPSLDTDQDENKKPDCTSIGSVGNGGGDEEFEDDNVFGLDFDQEEEGDNLKEASMVNSNPGKDPFPNNEEKVRVFWVW